MTRTVAAVAVALLIAVAAFGRAQTADAQGVYISGTTVIGGADRYDTSAQVAEFAYPDGSDIVYIASGEDFPDALSAASGGGPVLLVPRDGPLPESTRRVFARLTLMRESVFIVFVGGDHAISPGMRSQVLQAQGDAP
jgi:hypothetical protein